MKFDKLHIPRHWEPYYTRYPEGYSILEALIQWTSQVNEMVKNVNEWNIYLEDFVENFDRKLEPTVVKWLEKMLENGTLARIINETIFGELNTKVDGKQDFETLPYVDVKEYQRRNPKLTFTQAFQACLDKAKNTLGGVHVIVPSGTHQLTAELTVYSNTKIEAVEGAILQRYHEGYFLLNGVRGATYYEYLGNGNIQIIGGVWDGRGTQLEGTGSHFAFAHANRIIVRDCMLKDANSHHIEINSSKDVLVDNCQAIGVIESAIYTEAIQLDLSSQAEGFPAFGAYDMTPCHDIEVRDCYFGPSGTTGTKSISRAFGSHSTRIGRYHTDVRFLNNTIQGATDYGVQLLSYQDVVIEDNSFFDCTGGIISYAPQLTNVNHMKDVNGVTTTASQHCSGIKILDNKFRNVTGKAAVYLYGADVTGMIRDALITGNTFDETAADVNGCVVSRYAEFVDVSKNFFDNIDTIPISFSGYNQDMLVEGNRFYNAFSSCVRIIDNAHRFILSKNLCRQSGRHAFEIYGENVAEIVIADNIINGANGRNLDEAAIYIHSGVNQVSVRGNMINTLPNFVYTYAIYITQTSVNCVKGANVVETGSLGAISAASTLDMGDVILGQTGLSNQATGTEGVV